MLEREIDVLAGMFAQRTIADRESIHLADLLEADLPPGLKAYIRAEVRRWLEQDLAAGPKFSHLDTSMPEGDKKVRLFLQTLVPLYQFRRAEYLTILNHALHFVGSYLCRPRWTLERLVFDNAERASVQHLLARLEYLAEYRYFAVLLHKVIHRRKQSEFTLEEFRTLVKRIDDEVLRQHSARELAELTRPIFMFLKPALQDERDAIPLEPLLLFLEDKELKVLGEYVAAICRIRGSERLTISEFAEIAEDLYAGKPLSVAPHSVAVSMEAAEAVPPPAEQVPAPQDEPPAEVQQTSAPAEQMPGPMEQAPPPAEISPLPSESPKPGPAPSQPAAPAPFDRAAAARNLNIALSLTFAGLQETRTPAHTGVTQLMADLHALIPAEQKQLFITQVFRKDEEYFNGILDALNSMHSWKEASLYLNRLYELHELDPFTPQVVEFTDAVQRRFSGGGP